MTIRVETTRIRYYEVPDEDLSAGVATILSGQATYLGEEPGGLAFGETDEAHVLQCQY